MFCDTLEKNSGQGKYFGETKVNCIDIRQYDPDLRGVDFIIGGPPCQTFSAAGRRANGVLGTTDARGVLFREYVRLLKKFEPVGFLFENVYGIVGAEGGGPWREIVESFSDAGYTLHYRILDAADYGAPQHRERLIIVGLRKGSYVFPRPLFGPDSRTGLPFYSAAEAIETAPNISDDIPGSIDGRYGHLIPEIPPGLNYSYYTEKLGNPRPVFAWRSKFSDFMYKADPDVPVRTIKAQGGQYTGPFHWENRHFSVPEYKRLQTFPDAYEICGGRGGQIKQIGNSVPPQLARILALSIRDQVFHRAIPFPLDTLAPEERLGFRQRKRLLTKEYQEKAKKAIASQAPTAAREPATQYTADINDGFGLVEGSDCCYKISVRRGQSLIVDVSESRKFESKYDILIEPVSDWTLPAVDIRGHAEGSGPMVLTVLWKAIEKALVDMGTKADLVQLAGYYQYAPSVKCELTCADDDAGHMLRLVTSGAVTRAMESTEDIAKKLEVGEEDVLGVAKMLRSLGYEVRNWNTNAQIPRGCWIIPYEFPTLTPKSIQLHKEV